MSQPMPTVHPLTKHTNRAKANIEGIVFWVPALHQLTPVSCRQQVGWVSPLLLRTLPHMFPQPLPQAHWLCCEKHRGAEEDGWQGTATLNPNTQTWSWNVCARSHTHPSTCFRRTHLWYVHMQTHPHTCSVSFFFPLFLLHSAEL